MVLLVQLESEFKAPLSSYPELETLRPGSASPASYPLLVLGLLRSNHQLIRVTGGGFTRKICKILARRGEQTH